MSPLLFFILWLIFDVPILGWIALVLFVIYAAVKLAD